MAGANQIYGSGMIESGVTFDFAQLVMDNEFARMIKYCVAGIQVDDGTLMIDDIARVGSFGDFLSLDSTYAFMRTQSQPSLLDRRVRDDWKASGGSDLYTRASEKAREIVADHKPEPLDPHVLKRLQAIVEAADREMGVA